MGNQLWNATYGGASSDNAHSVVTAGEDGFVVGGRMSDEVWLAKFSDEQSPPLAINVRAYLCHCININRASASNCTDSTKKRLRVCLELLLTLNSITKERQIAYRHQ